MNVAVNVGYTAGSFDILHVEHVDQLQRARAHCTFLIVGVHSDDLVLELNGREPVNPFAERLEIVRSMTVVDAAVGQMTSDLVDVWQQVQFHTLVLPPHGPAAELDPIPAALHGLIEVVQLPVARRTSSTLHH